MDKEILKGFISIILLSLLKNNDMYGYQLSREIKELSNNQFLISEGTLYTALKRLEENNYITSYWVKIEQKLVERKYYKITLDGINILNEKIDDYKILNSIIISCLRGEKDE
ncbi:PadR family transcriptional regulator [Clostridium saccharoperbutylacetonicum]|uniref:PadR family transcriptional regulator n=1 Tax=Clostridium saccharoperbutylacetonicum TaxID=36745 RepID=UPI0039EA40E6